MTTIEIPPRPGSTLSRLVVVAAAAFALGFAAASAQTRDASVPAPATPSVSSAAEPTPYFPSQYELRAGPPEPHVEAF